MFLFCNSFNCHLIASYSSIWGKATFVLHFRVSFRKKNKKLLFTAVNCFPSRLAFLENRRRLATFSQGNREYHPKSNLAQNTNVPRPQEEHIAQFSEKIIYRITKMLSKEFSRTGSRVLGVPSHIGEFLLNPLIQSHSGTTPETSRNALSKKQRTNQEGFESDRHHETRVSQSQTTHVFWPRWCVRQWPIYHNMDFFESFLKNNLNGKIGN